MGLLGSLIRFSPKPQPQQKRPANPSEIMGPIKDDAKLVKERCERWQEVKNNMPQDFHKTRAVALR